MAEEEASTDINNSFGFLDIEIRHENLGRIIIELRQDLAPNAKECFHSLCTNVKKAGANGQSIVYKGAKYDEYQRLLTLPDGHLVIVNDGANGICIYRSHFDDIEIPTPQKKYKVEAESVDKKMNPGRHFDDSNVVLGQMWSNLDCLQEMENFACDKSSSLLEITIRDCGEIALSECLDLIPKQMLRCITAPKQNSPLHITNALSNELLQKVFSHLDLLDLANAADVCVRFEQNATAMFNTKYKNEAKPEVFLGQPEGFEAVMRKFGSSMDALHIHSGYHGINDIKTLELINRYAQSLKSLVLCEFYFDGKMNTVGLHPLFARLETLELIDCRFYCRGEKLLMFCAQLKVLRTDWSNDLAKIRFPKLKEASIYPVYRLSDKIELGQFVTLNSSLERLTFGYKSEFPSNRAGLIVQHFEKLGQLDIGHIFHRRRAQQYQFEKCMKSVSDWRSLEEMELPNDDFTVSLLMWMGRAHFPFGSFSKNCGDIAKDIETGLREKAMLSTRCEPLSNDHIIELGKGLTQLKELRLQSTTATKISTIGLRNMIEHAKKLSYLELVNARNIRIEMEDYEVILATVRNRPEKIRLSIYLCGGFQINVPKTVLLANREWLHIDVIDESKKIYAHRVKPRMSRFSPE